MAVTDFNVKSIGWVELLEFASVQSGLPTTQILNQIDYQSKQLFFNTSLNFDEAKAQALYSWLKQQGFDVSYNGSNEWIGSAFQTVAQQEMPSIANSNNSTIARGKLRQMYGNIKEFDGINHFMQLTKFPASGTLGQKALYVVGSLGQAASAVSTGINLGKMLSNAIYENAPNYWPDMDWSSYNPETWNGMINSDDTPFAGLFNFILGLDPDTGKAQTYMPENLFAYMAYLLAQNGWFDVSSQSYAENVVVDGTTLPFVYKATLTFNNLVSNFNRERYCQPYMQTPTRGYSWISSWNSSYSDPGAQTIDIIIGRYSGKVYCYYFDYSGSNSFDGGLPSSIGFMDGSVRQGSSTTQAYSYTYNSKTVIGMYTSQAYSDSNVYTLPIVDYNSFSDFPKAAWYAKYGEMIPLPTIDGLSDQPNATLPDTSTWTDVPTTLQSLQQQYPDLWNDALVWNTDDPMRESMGDTTTYIPFPWPDIDSATDTKPTTGNQTQQSLDVASLPDSLLQSLMQTIQATQPDDTNVPENPTDTGTGETPIPIVPTGSASALWSVYHPTQAQVNAFGAWLWTDNIIEQFVQAMNNPMEGIISLHKIFAPPTDSGNGTIVIGRLDSNVPTALVTEQYVTVDCGFVSLQEQFGNVFDYISTRVSMYLPFIGIIDLNVSDVMRSTLNVKYEVDIFTGACLATIYVNRDGRNAMLYQFTGVCSVEYPLTGGQHSSIINGFFGLMGAGVAMASGPAGTAVAAATALGASSSLANIARTTNARSGAFGANAGAMGIKKPYLIIERPQTKVATLFPKLAGYPTNYSVKVGDCTNQVVVSHVHVEGINATEQELRMIEDLLRSGILV